MVPACSFGPSVKRLLAAPRSLLLSGSVKACPGPCVPSLQLRTQLALSVPARQHRHRWHRGPQPYPRGLQQTRGKYRRIKVCLCLAPHKIKVPLVIPTKLISPSLSPHSQNTHPIFSVQMGCHHVWMQDYIQLFAKTRSQGAEVLLKWD